MLRSLFSGVSGMKSNQYKMDTIGNNIANVNTTAYKSGRVRFEDLFSQTIENAQAPSSTGTGGVNPKQVGLGVQISGIDTIMTDGGLQTTGRSLDLAMEGVGFFVVSDDASGNSKRYTRDGVFFTDYEGNLVNSGGQRVLGYEPTENGGEYTDDPTEIDTATVGNMEALKIPKSITDGTTKELESFSIDGTGLITGIYGGDTYYLGRVAVAKFNNPEGLEKLGGNTYRETNNSGAVIAGEGNSSGFGTIRSGVLEMSNVDLANEFTEMIITSRSYQANSRTITTSDEMLQELINLKR